jgi:hypothetical protein
MVRGEARIIFSVFFLCSVFRGGCGPRGLGRGRGRGRLLNASRAEQQASGDACCLVPHMLYMNLRRFFLP